MQDSIFNGERTQRMGNISTSTFIYNTRMYSQQSCNLQARNKSNTTDYYYYLQSLNRFYLWTRRHNMHSKAKERPPYRQGGRQGPWTFMTVSLGCPNGPTRPMQVTCPPRWSANRDVPSPRQLAWPRLIPGLSRGRRALSGAPRPDAQVRTTQPA